jgi:hypothetical protein
MPTNYSGYVDVSDRLQANAFLSGISPQLAPGLAVGDYLVDCSDYTGTAKDPYTGAGASPVLQLGNTTMAPLFFQVYAALKSGTPTVTATMSDSTVVALQAPEGLAGTEGGRAMVSVTPQSSASWGTYIFRLIRIVNVPANPAVAYSGDLYELGVTVPLPGIDPGPTRPAAPTIQAAGVLAGNVPQINVSGN